MCDRDVYWMGQVDSEDEWEEEDADGESLGHSDGKDSDDEDEDMEGDDEVKKNDLDYNDGWLCEDGYVVQVVPGLASERKAVVIGPVFNLGAVDAAAAATAAGGGIAGQYEPLLRCRAIVYGRTPIVIGQPAAAAAVAASGAAACNGASAVAAAGAGDGAGGAGGRCGSPSGAPTAASGSVKGKRAKCFSDAELPVLVKILDGQNISIDKAVASFRAALPSSTVSDLQVGGSRALPVCERPCVRACVRVCLGGRVSYAGSMCCL